MKLAPDAAAPAVTTRTTRGAGVRREARERVVSGAQRTVRLRYWNRRPVLTD